MWSHVNLGVLMSEYKKSVQGKRPQKKPNKFLNTIRLFMFWTIVIVIGMAVVNSLNPNATLKTEERTLTEILSYAKDGKLEKIEVKGNELNVTTKDGSDLPKNLTSRKDGSGTLQEQGFAEVIEEGKVAVDIKENVDTLGIVLDIALIVLPIIIIAGFLIYMMRQAQNMNNQSMGFGKAKARLYGNEKKKVTFDDVAGNEAAKQDLSEIVDFLKNPKKYERLGAKIPRGVLLAGEPGTGKTLIVSTWVPLA